MQNCRLRLARVMTQANENDHTTDQVRRGPGYGATDLGEPARAPAARRADRSGLAARPTQPPAGRAAGAGEASRDEPRRAGRAREGAAPLHDQGHRRTGRAQPRSAGSPSDRPAPGDAYRDPRGPGAGVPAAAAAGGVAGTAAAGAEPGRTRDAAGGSTDPGEAQPVLTGEAAGGSSAGKAARLAGGGRPRVRPPRPR